jgi:nucleoside phosphorylase
LAKRIDFAILAPLQEEIASLCEAFSIPEGSRCIEDGILYFSKDLSTRGRDINIRVVQLNIQGTLYAGIIATKLISRWKPRCLVSFGIAGGFIGDDVSLLDVIVPSVVYYYEPCKETTSKASAGGAPHSEIRLRSQPFGTWPVFETACRNNWLGGKFKDASVRFEPLASGEKLIADIDSPTRKVILNIHDKMAGVEMEAAGVGAAAKYSSDAEVRLIVVKGVSDDATKKKHRLKGHRVTAATNAARFLRSVLENDFDAGKLDIYDSLDGASFSRAFQEASQIYLAIRPALSDLDVHHLAKVIDPVEEPPTVYCHWREGPHELVHWVDFYHILLMRRLADFGLPSKIIITECEAPSERGRENLRQMVTSILGSNSSLIWSSEIERQAHLWRAYAEAVGFDDSVRETIKNAYHYLGRAGVGKSENLMQYIAWDSRDTKRCILLQWEKHAAISSVLSLLGNLTPLVLLVPDLDLAGKRGKFEEPGEKLFIDPPHFASILNWLETRPPVMEIRDLARHLAAVVPGSQEGDQNHSIDEILNGRESLREILRSENEPERRESIFTIIGILAGAKRNFFEPK